MITLFVNNIFENRYFFKENPLKSLTDFQKKIALTALVAVISLAAIITAWKYIKHFKKHKIVALSPERTKVDEVIINKNQINKTPSPTKFETQSPIAIEIPLPTKFEAPSPKKIDTPLTPLPCPILTNHKGINRYKQMDPKNSPAKVETLRKKLARTPSRNTPIAIKTVQKIQHDLEEQIQAHSPYKAIPTNSPLSPTKVEMPLNTVIETTDKQLEINVSPPKKMNDSTTEKKPEIKHLEETTLVTPQTIIPKANEGSFNQLWIKGENFRLEENYEEARKYFEKALQFQPEDALALSFRGYGFVLCALADQMNDEGDDENAEATYQKALQINPNNLFAMLCYSHFLMGYEDEDEIRKAKAYLERVLKICPSYQKGLEYYLMCLERLNIDEAHRSNEDKELIKKSELASKATKDPVNPPMKFGETDYEQGEYLLSLGEHFHASIKLKAVIEKNRQNEFAKRAYVEALLGLAVDFIKEEKYFSAAVTYCEKCLAIIPDHPFALEIIELCRDKEDDYFEDEEESLKEEKKQIEQSLEKDPGNLSLLSDYANWLMKCGKYEKAAATFMEVFEANPKDKNAVKALRELGVILSPIKSLVLTPLKP